MNHPRKELHELLEQVLPHDGIACGPERAAVLHMVREERARRRRRRTLGAALAVVAIACLINLAPGWLPRDGALARPGAPPATNAGIATGAPATPPAPSAPSRVVMQEVDDQQLLALLQDTPAALMVWPNGRRTLLVVER